METRICGSGVGAAEGGDESSNLDVVMEYAKAVADDILIRISVSNRGPEAAPRVPSPTPWVKTARLEGIPEPDAREGSSR